MNRRSFLGAVLALGAAPAIVRADALMKCKGETFIYAYGVVVPWWVVPHKIVLEGRKEGLSEFVLSTASLFAMPLVAAENKASPFWSGNDLFTFGRREMIQREVWRPTYRKDWKGRHVYVADSCPTMKAA